MADAWKFFVVEVTYKVPAEELGETVNEHRAFLQTGFDKGWLLMSGPQNPRIGGIIIARAPSSEALVQFFANDPYKVKWLAEYRMIEFDPIKRQDFMLPWITEGENAA